MQTVVFARNYDHPLNAAQHAAYLAGVTYENVPDDVVAAAGDACAPANPVHAEPAQPA